MHPYPARLEERIELRDGEHLLVRPIRPEDEPAHREFFANLTPRDVYCRFFGVVKGFSPEELARFTRIDYGNEMAFIATGEDGDHAGKTLGVVRCSPPDADGAADFAIVVRSDVHHRGLGHALMEKMIRYARDAGLTALKGDVLTENRAMISLAKDFGFRQVGLPSLGALQVRLDLNAAPEGSVSHAK